METKRYTLLTENQIDKLGNTLIYLLDHCKDLSKTKLLKLIYILDEVSIKKSGIPFFNLDYKIWQYGPVSEELFIELSDQPSLLKNFIKQNTKGEIESYKSFDDGEFSDNDMELLDYVIDLFASKTATELVNYTHRQPTPWYKTADKNGVLELLENGNITNTEILVDMADLVSHDARKRIIYEDYISVNTAR